MIKEILRRMIYFFKCYTGIVPLRSVTIETSSVCNRHCRFCPNFNHSRDAKLLDDKLFFSIIDQLAAVRFNGKLSFHLFNEPLLDKRIVYFLAYARKKLPKNYIYIDTNGDYLDLPLYRRLADAGLSFLTVTQYDGVIGANVKNMLEGLSSEEKQRVHVRTAPQHLCNRAGLVDLKSNAALPLRKSCFRPFDQLCVNYLGKVVLCCNDYSGAVEMGDLNRERVAKIWRNARFRYYRKKLFAKRREALKLCKECDL